MASILIGLAGSPKAAPVLRDNLDGTRTAIWTFDTGENLTFSNATLAGGAGTLDLSDYSWIQTTKKDFENGTGANVTYLDEGSLTLGKRLNPERIVTSRDTGNVYSFTALGALEWTGARSGHGRAIASNDWNKDTYPEGVAAASDNAAKM